MGENRKAFTNPYWKERKISFWHIAVLLVVIVALCWLLGNSGSADSDTYCGYEEHQHDADCYEQVLTCGFEEDVDADVHVHEENCYMEVLTCEVPEHEHGILCFSDGTADVETASDWESTLPEVIPDHWCEAVLAIARSQIGYEESVSNFCLAEDGETRQGYTRYGAWYGDEYGDWDAMFVSFCLSYAGVPEESFPRTSDAEEWTAMLDRMGLWASSDWIPSAGDLIFLDSSGSGLEEVSVGIVSDVSEGTNTLTVIEGNYCDAVCENTYDLDDARILGYGLLPENQETEPKTVIYEEDAGGVKIRVTVPDGALPENAVLNVFPYEESSEEYALALALVQDAKESASFRTLATGETGRETESDSLKFSVGSGEDTESGTVILDVFFTADGTEVEPESAAEVTIDASELLADCGGEVESLEVWHLEETEDGTEPVLAAATSDAESSVSFTVESFSEFAFHYYWTAGGFAGFSTNLIDENGNTISAAVSSSYTMAANGSYETTVEMPYTISIEEFVKFFATEGVYQFLYATVTDPNYGNTEHTFDEWDGEATVGSQEVYGSEENPVMSVKIEGTEANTNPNQDTSINERSKTWHFTLTYADGTSVTIPIYGNGNGVNDSGGKYCPQYLEINLYFAESTPEFVFHYQSSAGGFAGFSTNLFDENGDPISASVSSSYTLTNNGSYETTVDMPCEISMEEFAESFVTDGAYYQFQYATVTNPNYGDTAHTFDEWSGEEKVNETELYGSEENPVVSVTIKGTAAEDNPNYDPNNADNTASKTWHFTLTYANGESVTIPIYGNGNGAEDTGGKYCPKYLEINLYYEEGNEAVLNLGNSNGTLSDGDYTGDRDGDGSPLRYGTGDLNDYADADGNVTINLPSDDDLNQEFTVVGAVGTEGEEGYLPAVTIELGREQAYDYRLVGWINIATGEYYDVSRGSTTADIVLSDDNVFYADWIAGSYDHGSKDDTGLRDDTVSTSDFVTFKLFDYNELFNLYSASLIQNSTSSEEWADSGSLYSEPLLGQDETSLTSIGKSFIFHNNGTTHTNSYVLSHANPQLWNLWTKNGAWEDNEERYNFVLDAEEYWNITDPDSTILGMLYDENEESLGVHYVGEGDYLFWVDEDGYYTFDSDVSGAAYSQTDGRFYVYEDAANSFFPYNGHTDEMTENNGLTNYWFGMYMEVEFYLPNSTNSGLENNNQIDGKDMIFDFSGDDDILIFIDDQLVVDMSGIHGKSYSRINFSTNTVTYSMGLDDTGAPDTTGSHGKYSVDENLNLKAGYHTMKIYYMERGASESNLKIQFNITPDWEYESWPVQTVSAEKVWMDAQGNEIDPDDLPETYQSGVEVGLFDALGKAAEADDESGSEAVFGYTMENGSYTVEYEYEDGMIYQYVYTVQGNSPSLTYTMGQTSVTYNKTDQDGRVLDGNGYVIAWLDGEGETATLHIRIDQQTLNAENDWFYAWELLDPDGTYEVLELSGSSSYTTVSTKNKLTSHTYWSVIGEKELETALTGGGDLPIILTEAAQEHENTIGDAEEAYGWVMVALSDGSIATKEVKFSHQGILEIVTKDDQTVDDSEEINSSEIHHYQSTLGVTSQSEIDTLGSGAVWYVSDTKESLEEIGDAEEFYLYCLMGGKQYYLAVTVEAGSQTLSLTEDINEAAVFIYDFLGELRIVQMNGDEEEASSRVVIDQNGNIILEEAEDKADRNDVRIYTLSEIDTDGDGFSFTATNIFLPDLTIKKVDSESGNALSGVSFSLENEEGEYYAGLDSNQEVIWESTKRVFSTGSDGTAVFECLPEGTYTLTEEASLSGYNQLPSPILIDVTLDAEQGSFALSVSWKNAGGSDEIGKYVSVSDNSIELMIQNIPISETPPSEETTVTVNVTKIWSDKGNQYGTRPETITIYLLADGELVTDAYGDPVSAVISADDGWFWSFTDLPKYNADGKEIKYTIEEAAVPGYTTEIRDYVVTNTLETVHVEGSKIWNDGNDADGIRPDSITVHLYADGEEIAAAMVSEKDSWAWSFGDLPKYQQDGTTEIVYTIEEDPVDGYETEYDGYNIINSHAAMFDIPVTKEWDDGNDADGIRPGSVTVELYLNGEPTGQTLTLNEQNGWAGVFPDLENETDGVKNVWSIVETAVDGYESTVIGDADNGFVIINTHNPEEVVPPEENPDETEEPRTPEGPPDLSEEQEEPAAPDEPMETEPSMPQTGYRWNLALCIGMLAVGGAMLIFAGSGMMKAERKRRK